MYFGFWLLIRYCSCTELEAMAKRVVLKDGESDIIPLVKEWLSKMCDLSGKDKIFHQSKNAEFCLIMAKIL